MTRYTHAALASLAALGLLFTSPVSARPGKAGPEFAPTAEMQAVHSLKKQIAAEELAAALELSPDQKSALAALIQEGLSARDDARETRSEMAAEAEPILAKYLAEVQASGKASAPTIAALQELGSKTRDGREGKAEAGKAMKQQLRSILGEAQLETLGKFRPMADVGPAEEVKAKRGERRAKRKERAREFADENEIGDETLERMRDGKKKKHARKRGRKTVKNVLMSKEMLDVLSR